jgi:hypothetical protein
LAGETESSIALGPALPNSTEWTALSAVREVAIVVITMSGRGTLHLLALEFVLPAQPTVLVIMLLQNEALSWTMTRPEEVPPSALLLLLDATGVSWIKTTSVAMILVERPPIQLLTSLQQHRRRLVQV